MACASSLVMIKGVYLCIDSKQQPKTRQSLHGKCGRNALPCPSSSIGVLYVFATLKAAQTASGSILNSYFISF